MYIHNNKRNKALDIAGKEIAYRRIIKINDSICPKLLKKFDKSFDQSNSTFCGHRLDKEWLDKYKINNCKKSNINHYYIHCIWINLIMIMIFIKMNHGHMRYHQSIIF